MQNTIQDNTVVSEPLINYLEKCFKEMPLGVCRDLFKLCHDRAGSMKFDSPEDQCCLIQGLRFSLEELNSAVHIGSADSLVGECADLHKDRFLTVFRLLLKNYMGK